jgi:hypothetical protein
MQKRISRITWNENGWIKPSGKHGKSNNPDSFEAKYGYGHEEWLFDTGKIINGFHYAFLEPIRKQQDLYIHDTYDIWLYTINSISKKRYWVGILKNVKVLDHKEAVEVLEIYKGKNWFNEMKNEIRQLGLKSDVFANWKGLDLFNIKFKINDCFINNPYFELESNHPVYKNNRYVFTRMEKYIEINKENAFEFKSDENDDDYDTNIRVIKKPPRISEIEPLHSIVSNKLSKYLKGVFGRDNVRREHPTGNSSTRIDIVVNGHNNIIFYEIKTYSSIITSIREAIGQLLEYSYFPNCEKANEMIIVSHMPIDENTKSYLINLRGKFNIPIFYQYFDVETEILSKKY